MTDITSIQITSVFNIHHTVLMSMTNNNVLVVQLDTSLTIITNVSQLLVPFLMIIVLHIAMLMKREINSANGFWDVRKSVKNVMKDIILTMITIVLNSQNIVKKLMKMENVPNVRTTTNLINMENVFQSLVDHVMTTVQFTNGSTWKEIFIQNGLNHAKESVKFVALATVLIMTELVSKVQTHYVLAPTLMVHVMFALQDQSGVN